jgi:hypothetical protein
MANLLTITKEPNDYFSFVLNGDVATEIKNTRNDLLTVGNIAHFKTANGANLIKEQDVIYFNITIIDGANSLVPVSVDDLFSKLISVGFFDWINGSGGGGVDRFDELADTFSYFGNDGKIPMVDESQLKLVPFTMPNVAYLDKFPDPLEANKMLVVDPTGQFYIFTDPLNVVTQEIRELYTETSPSEDAVFKALALKTNISDAGLTEQLDFEANGVDNFIDIGTEVKAKSWFYASVLQQRLDWSQTGTIITFTFIPDAGAGVKNLQFI